VRGANGLDQTTILQQAAPGVSPDVFIDVLAGQLGLDGDLEEAGEVEVNGRSWSLFEGILQGLPVDIGLAAEDGNTFVVLLISNADERDGLYEAVFLPAMDALDIAE